MSDKEVIIGGIIIGFIMSAFVTIVLTSYFNNLMYLWCLLSNIITIPLGIGMVAGLRHDEEIDEMLEEYKRKKK
ncbi:MAG: hypothetical protein WC516_07805 [Patescibacteria group bacterium]|jgi:uncharacterized protein YacL